MMFARDVAATYLRWTFLRAVFHRGWWLVTSLYLVAVAELSAFELVFLGTAQNLVALSFEVPAGVMADAISRKWSVVLAHLLMGAAMLATGLVTSFPALVATQMLWGLAWTFSSGADVAWLTDELDDPDRSTGVLIASARLEQLGAAAGLIGFGLLAWTTNLSTSIVLAGISMWGLGLFVVASFAERHFTPIRTHRLRASFSIFRRGVSLARSNRQIMIIFAATFLLNGAAEAFDRLFPKRLLELGFPTTPEPIVWLTALGLATLGVGAASLRLVETRINGTDAPRRIYVIGSTIGAFGLVVFALAPDDITGMAGVLLVGGIAWSVTRSVSIIWTNREATADVRATLQSFLAQAEYVGELVLGTTLGILAQLTNISIAMLGSVGLVASAAILVARSRSESRRLRGIES